MKKYLNRLAKFLFNLRTFVLSIIIVLTIGHLRPQTLNKKYNVTVNKLILIEALHSVESQIGDYKFGYDKGLIESNKSVISINLKEVALSEINEQLSAQSGLNFKLVGRNIIISRKQNSRPTSDAFSSENRKSVSISGVVNEGGKANPIIGATVFVKGTTNGMSTDAKGNFSLKVHENDTVQISFVGLKSQQFAVIKGLNFYTINLVEESLKLDEVVITGAIKKTAENAVIAERKKATVSQDAISTELMQKSGSLNVTAALEKVTGVTIANGKEISIRGLGDRNVVGQINGIRMASANADNNSVQMDLVPAGILENITVFKSVTPDKPADATAGIIELRTKSFPEQMILNFSVQTGTNSNVGFGGYFNSFENSDPGNFGQNVQKKNLSKDFLNLSNEYPTLYSYKNDGELDLAKTITSGQQIRNFLSSAHSTQDNMIEARRIDGIMKSFDPILATSYKKAKPNQVYSANFGNKYVFGSQTIGFVLGVNYTYQVDAIRDGSLTEWSIYNGIGTALYPYFIPPTTTANNVTLNPRLTQSEQTGKENITYGGLAGLGWRFAPDNEINFNYILNRNAKTEASQLIGEFKSAGSQFPVMNMANMLKQEETKLDIYQARGKHKILPNNALSPIIEWAGSYNKSSQNTPDYRFTSVIIDYNYYDYFKDRPKTFTPSAAGSLVKDPDKGFWTFLLGNRPSLAVGAPVYDPNMRSYRNLDETTYSAQADITIPFKIAAREHKVKTGYNYFSKERTYVEYNQSLPSSLSLYNANGDLNNMISLDKVGINNSFDPSFDGQAFPVGYIYNAAKTANNYHGKSQVGAAYVMTELQIHKKLKLVGGVRFEQTDINAVIDTSKIFAITTGTTSSVITPLIYKNSYNPEIIYKANWKPYYAINLIYSPNKDVNIRSSFNTTLARPELREMIPITQYDPFQFAIVTGNPKLKNQFTQAAEVRAEWFPTIGEVVSVTAFGKLLYDQLVQSFSSDSSGTRANGYTFNKVQFLNDNEKGQVVGMEFEIRKRFDFISPSLKDFYVGANITLASSRVKKNPDRLAASRLLDNTSPEYSPIINQPPYAINAYLDYDNRKSGTGLNINFNMVGERLKQIVLTGEPDIYTLPAPMLNVTFSQLFLKHWTFKGYVKNMINPNLQEAYTNYGDNGSYFNTNYLRREYKRGTELLIGLTYTIF